MDIPVATSAHDVRALFASITDAAVVLIYDLLVFDEEGEEQDPIGGCRVFVRTHRVAQIIHAATGWPFDGEPNDDIGYQPAATFTLAQSPEDVQSELVHHLCSVPIYRRGRWINTFQPPER